MGFTLTSEEKEQAEKNGGSLIRPLPGANGAKSGTFHNPVTGQEIVNQPIDTYHLTRRLQQGWQMGPASAELKEKWVIREAELRAEDDKRVEDYLKSNEHQEGLDDQAQGFNDAVATAAAAAVAQILEKLGVELPKTADAPTETETKQQVSEASRPKLHLVD
jgi:hypothetical protein